MNEQQANEAVEPDERPDAETSAPDAAEAPRNRAERRHGAAADQAGNRPVPGKRGSFSGPFHAPGPGQKRTHSHRKTG